MALKPDIDKRYDESIRGRYRTLRRCAARRGLPFSISLEEFSNIVAVGKCSYCAHPLPKRGYGLDRVDSSRGYSAANCVAACVVCNRAKGSLTTEEFKQWGRRLAAFIGL